MHLKSYLPGYAKTILIFKVWFLSDNNIFKNKYATWLQKKKNHMEFCQFRSYSLFNIPTNSKTINLVLWVRVHAVAYRMHKLKYILCQKNIFANTPMLFVLNITCFSADISIYVQHNNIKHLDSVVKSFYRINLFILWISKNHNYNPSFRLFQKILIHLLCTFKPTYIITQSHTY